MTWPVQLVLLSNFGAPFNSHSGMSRGAASWHYMTWLNLPTECSTCSNYTRTEVQTFQGSNGTTKKDRTMLVPTLITLRDQMP
ncbi:hypothetical protein PVAP13_6KG400050 [Panicum virgatum]|uniref:Uncharacterized protein n=1 Tax=Panicum virgatum TaxID=38727 RepID=A0A8T0RHK9_PANVG|nr:hypothetical protein PVAP13_6KG400050 [Panicum virgatum]